MRFETGSESKKDCAYQTCQEDKEKDALLLALETRVLTDEEMLEVRRLDIQLFVHNNEAYDLDRAQARIDDATFRQARLRLLAAQGVK
jgi:hypothetical protein